MPAPRAARLSPLGGGAAFIVLFSAVPWGAAQTAADVGSLRHGGACLELLEAPDGASSSALSVAKVVVRPCADRPSQRWTVLYGDYDWVQWTDGRRLSRLASGRLVVGDPADGDPLRWQPERFGEPGPVVHGAIVSLDGRCLTQRGGRVQLETCVHGAAAQRWALHRAAR